MGAMPWHILGPYDADLSVAVRRLQHRYFEENYEEISVIAQRALQSAEDCVAAVKDNDEYGLLWTYTDTLEQVRRILDEPIPTEIEDQINLLRKLWHASGDTFDNILDVVKISENPEPWSVAPLTDDEMEEYFNTLKPTRMLADQLLFKVYDRIDRAETVCFPVYQARKPHRSLGIMYVGYTAD